MASSPEGTPPVPEETLRRFLNDFPRSLKTHQEWGIGIAPRDRPEEKHLKKYCWGLIQNHAERYQHAAIVVTNAGEELQALPSIFPEFREKTQSGTKVIMKVHHEDQDEFSSDELVFTGNVYLYTDQLQVPKEVAQAWFRDAGMKLLVRDDDYWQTVHERGKPDVFICHDSRDKDAFVRPLAKALSGVPYLLRVWYDEFSMEVGDSLIGKIDEGLAACRYGVVVLSKNFLSKKKWTAREFRGLTNREVEAEDKLVLPVWLDVTRDEVAQYSPPLADKFALQGSDGVEEVAKAIFKVVRKK